MRLFDLNQLTVPSLPAAGSDIPSLDHPTLFVITTLYIAAYTSLIRPQVNLEHRSSIHRNSNPTLGHRLLLVLVATTGTASVSTTFGAVLLVGADLLSFGFAAAATSASFTSGTFS